MNALEIIEEFDRRSKSARTYRNAGALLLAVSTVLLVLYGINQSRIGAWAGALLAAGLAGLVASLALAMLGLVKRRCPNCDRVLGEVFQAAFCPSCGAALRTDPDFETVPAVQPARKAGGKSAAGRTALSRSGGRRWEPRSGTPGIDEFPEEEYPKNIRLFTTSDEMELTKRYIHLIDRDNSVRPALGSGSAVGKLPKSLRPLLQQPSDGEEERETDRTSRRIRGLGSLEARMAVIAGIVLAAVVLFLLIAALL